MSAVGKERLQLIGIGGAGCRLALRAIVRLRGEARAGVDSPFFTISAAGVALPATLFIAPEPGAAATLQAELAASPLAFHPEFTKIGRAGASRLVGRGQGPVAAAMMPTILDAARRRADTGRDDGFVLVHALAGGSGSGLAAALATALRSAYPKARILTIALLPSATIDASPLDPVNAGVGLARLLGPANALLVADNDAAGGGKGRGAADGALLETLADLLAALETGARPLRELVAQIAPHRALPIAFAARASGTGRAAVEALLGGTGARLSLPRDAWNASPARLALLWRGVHREAAITEALAWIADARGLTRADVASTVVTTDHVPKSSISGLLLHRGASAAIDGRVLRPMRRLVEGRLHLHRHEAAGLTLPELDAALARLTALVRDLGAL